MPRDYCPVLYAHQLHKHVQLCCCQTYHSSELSGSGNDLPGACSLGAERRIPQTLTATLALNWYHHKRASLRNPCHTPTLAPGWRCDGKLAGTPNGVNNLTSCTNGHQATKKPTHRAQTGITAYNAANPKPHVPILHRACRPPRVFADFTMWARADGAPSPA